MWFDVWLNGRDDIERPAVLRQEDFNARTGGLERLDEDETVLVRNNH
jgi:hypothetical protein